MRKLSFIKKLFYCLLVVHPAILSAQIFNTDSIKTLLAAARVNATKIKALTKLSNYYSNFNPDSEMYYASLLKDYALQVKNKSAEGYATGNIGEAYFRKGDDVQALATTFSALNIFEDIRDSVNIADIDNDLGNIYLRHDLKTALAYYTKCRVTSEKIHDHTDDYYSCGNLGIVFDELGKIDSSVYYLKKAINIHERWHVNYTESYFQSELSIIYDKEHKYAMASAILSDGIKDDIKSNDKKIYLLQLRYADHFADLNKPDSALLYASQVLNNPVVLREPEIASKVYNTLARIYAVKKQFDQAYQYQLKSGEANNTLFNTDKEQQLANLTFNERQHKIDLENTATAYKSKLRFYVALIILIGAIALTGILWNNNRKQHKANKLLSSQKKQIQTALQELKSAQVQLVQAEKMASLGELTAGIAHEIQNPLNFVNNFSEVNKEMLLELEDEIKTGNTDQALALAAGIIKNEEKISHHGKRADVIVKGMLEHSRTGSGQKQLTDLNALADECLRLAYHGFQAKNPGFNAVPIAIGMVTSFDESLQKIEIVPQDIGRVLLNLFNNAFYAVNEKRKTAGPDYKPTVEVRTSSPPSADGGRGVELIVRDNGDGIPDAIKDKIMQPFFTTKPTGEGTGLGLSLSYDIVVKGHGGSIAVESKAGEGSEFIIQFPLTGNP